jgi:phospholipase/carboxylesterase
MFLSGTMVDAAEWVPRMTSRRGLPVLATHGRADTVLPFTPAEEVATRLAEAGAAVRFVPFEGGHEVTSEVSRAVGAFLNQHAR